jgi:hypothetical protein
MPVSIGPNRVLQTFIVLWPEIAEIGRCSPLSASEIRSETYTGRCTGPQMRSLVPRLLKASVGFPLLSLPCSQSRLTFVQAGLRWSGLILHLCAF